MKLTQMLLLLELLLLLLQIPWVPGTQRWSWADYWLLCMIMHRVPNQANPLHDHAKGLPDVQANQANT